MADFIVAGILFLMISVATIYIIKAKKVERNVLDAPLPDIVRVKKAGIRNANVDVIRIQIEDA